TPFVKKLALYEPPIPSGADIHSRWFNKYSQAIADNNYGKAFITILKATADSSIFNYIPSFISAPLFNFIIKNEDKKPKKDTMSFKDLIEMFPYDYTVMLQSRGLEEKAKSLKPHVLLLGGNKSQSFLKNSLDTLNKSLPQARRITFPGL